jgi:predicted nuclease with TOPRIM domain
MADNINDTGIGSNPVENTPERPRGGKGLIYGILIAALLGTWGYLIWDKSKSTQQKEQLQTQVITIDSSKSAVQEQFRAALAQLDMLKTANDSLMHTKDKQVADLKARISSILNRQHTSASDLAEAKALIGQLNSRLEGYREQIEQLKGEKVVLVTQRDSIKRNYDTATVKNQQLTQQVDLGSVLHASDFNITPIHLKKSGKEVTTTKAKRADLMRISFDIDRNRIAPPGQKDLYICITSPNGSPLAVEALGSGRFTLADGTEKLFTAQKSINYTTGKDTTITVDWKQNSDFVPGAYKVEVYELGYLIGQGSVDMKKGGLF